MTRNETICIKLTRYYIYIFLSACYAQEISKLIDFIQTN